MHVTGKISFITCVALMFFSCVPQKPSTEEDQHKLLAIHGDARNAHFGANAKAMVDQMTEDMISVNAGKIHTSNPQRDLEGFQSYFNSVKFKKWDDVKPPEIRFSDDHSLAYMVVDKLVVLEAKDGLGKPIEETTHYAWLAIYRKQADDNWKLECIASTNEPEQVKPIE
jgi:ketosteroid isomerase-like protein